MFNKFVATKPLLKLLTRTLAAGSIVLGVQQNAQALTFNFNFSGGTSTTIKNKVKDAGRLWENAFHDDVTVNIEFQYGALPDGYLGGARPNMLRVNYGDAIPQLGLDRISADDQTATQHLPTTKAANGQTSIARWINRTATQSKKWHTDTSTTNLWLTRANAKALGIVKGNDQTIDAVIRLNSGVNWDFYPYAGIKSGQYDFMGTVVHELGHTLGFLSGVDVLDFYAKQQIYRPDTAYDYVTSMDLFRRSDWTIGKGQIAWTVDETTEYFSINGGRNRIANFTNGAAMYNNADDFQLSHFRANEASVMRPVLYSGQRSAIGEVDLRLLDTIGWDRTPGSRTNYGASIAHTVSVNEFDSSLTWGNGWGNTKYRYSLWQEGNFMASKAGGPAEPQDVPEPGSMLGLGAIALLGIKSRKKRA